MYFEPNDVRIYDLIFGSQGCQTSGVIENMKRDQKFSERNGPIENSFEHISYGYTYRFFKILQMGHEPLSTTTKTGKV